MLRNVLTDSEMDRLKELAGPKVCVSHFLKLLFAAVVFVVYCGCCCIRSLFNRDFIFGKYVFKYVITLK